MLSISKFHFILYLPFITVLSVFSLKANNLQTERGKIDRLPYYQLQERDSLISNFDTIEQLYKKYINKKDDEAKLKSFNAYAVVLRENGKFKDAFKIADQVLKLSEKLNNKDMLMVAYNNYAILCRRVERLTDASSFHLKALKLAETNTNQTIWLVQKSKCVALNGLGNIALSVAQYEKAKNYFTAALSIEIQLKSNIGIAINYANIGSIYQSINKLDSAISSYNLSLAYNRKENCTKGIAICLVSIGNIQSIQNNHNKAIENYKTALHITDSIGDVYHWLASNQSFIDILLKQKKYKEARENAYLSIEKSKQAGIWYFLYHAYLSVAQTYENENNTNQALTNFKLSYQYKDSIDKESNFAKIQDLQLKYETEKKEQQIELLTTQDKNDKLTRNALIICLLLLILLAASLWKIAQFRKKNLQQKELLLAREQDVNKMLKEKHIAEIETKNKELIALANQLATKNEVLNNLKSSLSVKGYSSEVLSQLNSELMFEKDWEMFYLKFENVHPLFFIKLRQQYPEITAKDERLCAYLRINMTSKEIAQILNVTVAAIDKSRNRLRKKLALPPDINLVDAMHEIG